MGGFSVETASGILSLEGARGGEQLDVLAVGIVKASWQRWAKANKVCCHRVNA